LLSDLTARDQPLHAHAFRGGYLGQSGDYHACRVLPVYRAHRALVRAKVAALSASEAEPSMQAALRSEQRRLLDCARSALAPRRPRLLLMCGLSGSGKTWVARTLAPPLNAIHLRSDLERKRRAGLGERDRSGSALATGLYTTQATASVYRHLGRCAEDALAGGCDVIVDASFLRRDDRAAFRELAKRLNITLQLIYCNAPPRALQARVALRQRAQQDASEADLRVLDWQAGQFEPPTSEESIEVISADTTDPNVYARVLRSIGSTSLH
jgi:predicted kinase